MATVPIFLSYKEGFISKAGFYFGVNLLTLRKIGGEL